MMTNLFHPSSTRPREFAAAAAGRTAFSSPEGLRDALARAVGLDRFSPPAPPVAPPELIWRRQHPLGTLERWVFAVEDGMHAPLYRCVPHGWTPADPLIICLQGHTSGMHRSIAVDQADETTAIEVEGDRDFGLGAMRHGFAALCPEIRGFGERHPEYPTSVAAGPGCVSLSMHALLLGHTLLAERLHDVRQTALLAVEAFGADPARVGVMGNSGGGTLSLYAAALLEEIRYALPSCAFSGIHESLGTVYHCPCNFVPGLYRLADMGDIAALAAPKPLVIVSGVSDPLFPIDAARREAARAQAVYAEAGAPERFRFLEGPEGHRFYADLAWPVLRELVG
ncbi:hypothetical protein DB346_03465 [Verrucomicrobia bacterium LW23]|nr:hypothetical protein DB346_03465 [Verrucomicrobia bacterium LW23]